MGAFQEVRLPARLAFGSTGGVERRTEITTLASGFERRSTPWALGRRRYLIGANLRSLDDMAELVAFFEARRGPSWCFWTIGWRARRSGGASEDCRWSVARGRLARRRVERGSATPCSWRGACMIGLGRRLV